MQFLPYLTAAIIATTGMTIFVNVISVITRKNMFVLRILANMLGTLGHTSMPLRPAGKSYIAAVLLHYAIGVLFAVLYWALRNTSGYVGHQSAAEPVIIGIVLGLIGVSGWMIFIRLHPDPPHWVPWAYYLLLIFMGHIVFSFLLTSAIHYFDQLK